MSTSSSSSWSSISSFPPPAHSPLPGCCVGWREPGRHGKVFALHAVAVTHGDTRIYHNKGFLFVLGICNACPIFCIQKGRQRSQYKCSCYSRSVFLTRGIFVVTTIVNWSDMHRPLRTGRRGCKKYLP